MKARDDYISGPHHYWTHFICGFVVGAAFGAWLGYHVADERWITFAVAATSGLSFALPCGRWGDDVWKSVLENWWLRW